MTEKPEEMSAEELAAKTQAAMLGQLQMMQSAIQALIGVAEKPDYIRFHLTSAFAAIANSKPIEPELAWMPHAIAAGAQPVFQMFLDACKANEERSRPTAAD